MAKNKKKMSMRDRVKKRAEGNMNRGGNRYLQIPEGVEQIRPKKKTYRWDIIPYKVNVNTHPEVQKGDLWFQRTYFVHFNVGPDNKAVVCPRTIKKPCPICEHVKELYNSDTEENTALAKEIKAKERELYNLIDLDDPDKGVQIFEMSYHLFGKALDEEIYEGEDELGDFAELSGGKTLVVSFRAKKLGSNEFMEVRKIEFEDRDDYDDSILDETHDLDSLLSIFDYETLQKLLFGIDEEDEEEDDDKPKKGKKGKASSKKVEEDDEDDSDDDEDEDDSDEEEEEEKPKKGKKTPPKKGKKKPVEEEEEDDDNDDDEEEEEEKPKKGKKGKKGKSSLKCPHGGTFAEDVDELDECEDCKLWTKCQEASEAA